jgi:hypothetical protein
MGSADFGVRCTTSANNPTPHSMLRRCLGRIASDPRRRPGHGIEAALLMRAE